MQIFNATKKTLISRRGTMAQTAGARLIGLLGRASIGNEEAMVLTDCRSVHMFFMRFAIDVIFVDRTKKVLRLTRNLKPFQISPYVLKAYYAVEGPVGMIDNSKTEVGDIVAFEEEGTLSAM